MNKVGTLFLVFCWTLTKNGNIDMIVACKETDKLHLVMKRQITDGIYQVLSWSTSIASLSQVD